MRKFIIHLLGGLTEQECHHESLLTRWSTAVRIRTYLDLMNGTPADDWCKQAYAFIQRVENEWGEEIDKDNQK